MITKIKISLKSLTYLLLAVVFLSDSVMAAYTDRVYWWYNNPSSSPGSYMVYGSGITAENGAYYNGVYRLGTNFRQGEVTFRRSLTEGTVKTYFNSYLFKTYETEYIAGGEDYLRLSFGSSYSAGNLKLLSTYIRYYSNSEWTDWIDQEFSYTVPISGNTKSITIDLPTDLAYEAYDVKYTISVPSSSDNKAWGLTVRALDNTESDYDPLAASEQTPVPEPISMVLLGISTIGMFLKLRLGRK